MARVIRSDEWQPQPWRNGGGITHEIVRWPATGEYSVRASVADVERAGPFSTFPGYRRWSTLLAGSIELVVAGDSHALALGMPVEFAGDAAIAAYPRDRATLLNLIARDARVGIGAPPAQPQLVVVLASRLTIVDPDELPAEPYVWLIAGSRSGASP
jgi:hypothetical protein